MNNGPGAPLTTHPEALNSWEVTEGESWCPQSLLIQQEPLGAIGFPSLLSKASYTGEATEAVFSFSLFRLMKLKNAAKSEPRGKTTSMSLGRLTYLGNHI